jgi:hypothetical protein
VASIGREQLEIEVFETAAPPVCVHSEADGRGFSCGSLCDRRKILSPDSLSKLLGAIAALVAIIAGIVAAVPSTRIGRNHNDFNDHQRT